MQMQMGSLTKYIKLLSLKKNDFYAFANTHFFKHLLIFSLLYFTFLGTIEAQYAINKNIQDEQLIVSTMNLIYNFEFDHAQK